MGAMGFSSSAIDSSLKTTAALLHLGDVSFEPARSGSLSTSERGGNGERKDTDEAAVVVAVAAAAASGFEEQFELCEEDGNVDGEEEVDEDAEDGANGNCGNAVNEKTNNNDVAMDLTESSRRSRSTKRKRMRRSALGDASLLLGVSEKELEVALTTRTIRTKDES